MTRTGRLGRAALSWLGVAALSFVVAEVALRTILDVQPLTPGQFVFEAHPTRGWTHRAGASDRYVKLGTKQDIHINSHNLREREIPYEREAGVRRVLVVGDSQVAGFEVAEGETFTRVAERALRAEGIPIEVINAGFRGYGTDQVLLWLQEEGLRYRPDLVIYVWAYNDPEDNMTIHRPFRRFGKGWFDLAPDGSLRLQGTPVPEFPQAANVKVGDDGKPVTVTVPFAQRMALYARDATITRSSVVTAVANIAVVIPFFWQGIRGVASYQDFAPPVDRASRLYRVTEALLRDMERTVRESGADFRVASLDGPWGTALRDSLGIRDLPVLERFTATLARQPDAKVVVPFDSHLNALGHRLYGEALADSLREAGLAGAPAAPAAG